MIRFLKKIVLRGLPRSLQHGLRRLWYPAMLRRFREESWPCSQPVRMLLHPGDHVVDAGANIGYVSLLLARWVGEQGCVYSIEPVPETFDLLAHNVRRLGIENVRLFHCAVSDHDGVATMEIPRYDWGGENLYESRITGEVGPASATRRVSVTLRRLDSLIPEGGPLVSLIKLDVEGHELPAVKGAASILEGGRPAWLIEVSGDPDDPETPANQLFQVMARYGYGVYFFEGNRFKCRRPGQRSTDYFFLGSDHVKHLPLGAG